MSKEKLAVVMVILAGTLWAAIGITVRGLSLVGLTAVQIVVCRFMASAAVLFVLLTVTDKQKLKIQKSDYIRFAALGCLCILFFNICYSVTIKVTSLSVAVALLYTSPIWAMLLSIVIFKEKLTKRKVFAIILSFTGCALITGLLAGEAKLTPLGLLTGLMSGIGYGSYGIFAKVLLGKYHSLTVTFYSFLMASIGGLAICRFDQVVLITVNAPIVIIYIFAAAVFCILSPYVLYTTALNYIEASRAAVIASVEPVMATIFGMIVYKEEVTTVMAIGMAFILLALFVLNKTGQAEV